jgi:hypothetical protein
VFRNLATGAPVRQLRTRTERQADRRSRERQNRRSVCEASGRSKPCPTTSTVAPLRSAKCPRESANGVRPRTYDERLPKDRVVVPNVTYALPRRRRRTPTLVRPRDAPDRADIFLQDHPRRPPTTRTAHPRCRTTTRALTDLHQADAHAPEPAHHTATGGAEQAEVSAPATDRVSQAKPLVPLPAPALTASSGSVCFQQTRRAD